MKTIINTTHLPIPATVELDGDKIILTGANGKGKTTILNCLATVATGVGVGNADLALYSVDGKKPTVDVFCDGKRVMVGDYEIFDLRALSQLTGTQRADYLFDLLGGKVMPEDIAKVINDLTPPHLQKATLTILKVSGIDAAITAANEAKKEADTQLAGTRAMAKVAVECNVATVQADIARLENIVADKYSEERARLVLQGKALKEELGDKADRDPSELFSKINAAKSDRAEILEQARMQQDTVNTLSGQCSALRLAINALKDSSECPTCGHKVEPTTVENLTRQYAGLTEREKAATADLKAMRSDAEMLGKKIAIGEELLKKLNRLYDLREGLKAIPKGQYSSEQVVEASDKLKELKTLLAQHEQVAKASEQVAKLEEEAKVHRAIESALKQLKAKVAEASGFPARVADAVKNTLGYELGFGKIGRVMDITVTRDGITRAITTLSAGEWQVVAACFGLMKPTAWVLVEAAEIDNAHYDALLTALATQTGLVVVADWQRRKTGAAWKQITLDTAKAKEDDNGLSLI